MLLIAVLLAVGRRQGARDLARFVPDCIVLVKRLLRDPRVPRRAKIALGLVLPYLAMPFDLVPDFLPVVGQIDDAILVAAAISYAMRSSAPDVVRDLWPGSERNLRIVLALSPGLDQRGVGGEGPPV